MFYRHLQRKFLAVAEKHSLLEENISISARILQNSEAIGNPTRQDYPLLKGKEFMMEASFRNCRGQAFTDAPCERISSLRAIINLPLDRVQNRALFIAGLNAVIRYLRPELATIHCHDDEPESCASEMVRRLRQLKAAKIGLIGLQPALLEALANTFGAGNLICVDRDESLRSTKKFGVPIRWGNEWETKRLFRDSEVVLATGSTVVNGSLPNLLQLAEISQTQIFFYGTSIAGTADLMGLKRFCFEAA